MATKDEMKPVFSTLTQTTALTAPAKQLKPKRRLTLDATSIARLKEIVCRVDGEFEEIRTQLGRALAIPITDCVDNASYLMICNAQLVSGIERSRERVGDKPGTIVGKYFAIKAGEIVAGKRFRRVEVWEVEVAR